MSENICSYFSYIAALKVTKTLSGVGSGMEKRPKNNTEILLKCISEVACDSNPNDKEAAGKEV